VLRAIALDVPGLCVVPQQWVGDVGCVDLLDHRLRLVIEAESFQWHSTRRAWERDVRRYTLFTRLGYTVVRFTWGEVMYQPDYVRAVLLDLLALGPRPGAVRRFTA
jgi:very-short-patch-repair endonuclease